MNPAKRRIVESEPTCSQVVETGLLPYARVGRAHCIGCVNRGQARYRQVGRSAAAPIARKCMSVDRGRAASG